jgi:hypothetical protein
LLGQIAYPSTPMPAATEREICDHIAKNLILVEPGLRLVQREYPLANPSGAAGRIDILARDPSGTLVVIELKKADGTARTALHELMKYLALLQDEKGVESKRLRLIVLSTHWHELLVPFSELVHSSPFTIGGRVIALGTDGLPCSTRMVVPLPKAEGLGFPSSFPWLVFSDASSRDTLAEKLVLLLPAIGVPHAVLVGVNSTRPNDLSYPFGLVLVIIPLAKAEAEALLQQGVLPIELLEDRSDEQPFEEQVLDALHSEIFCMDEVGEVHLSRCSNFAEERKHWTVEGIYRIGPKLSDATVLTDEEILEQLLGLDGRNNVVFIRAVRASHKMQMENFCSSLIALLGRFPGWLEAVQPLLSRARSNPDATVIAQAFCPDEFLRQLAFYWRFDDPQRLPSFRLTLTDSSGLLEEMRGKVGWDGTTIPTSIDEALPDLGVGGNVLRLAMSPREDADKLVAACGIVFPVATWTPAAKLKVSCDAVSLAKLEAASPETVAVLRERLGPISSTFDVWDEDEREEQ